VTTSNTQFVVPLYSRLDASGTASVNVVQEEVVTMAYDSSYNYVCADDAESAKLLDAFQLSQDGSNLVVSMDHNGAYATNFKAVLQDVLEDASNNLGETLTRDLYNDALNYFQSIYGDDVANVLQTDWSLSVAIDSVGGAQNMWNDLDANAGARLLLAEQIPNNHYMIYTDASENMTTDSLPMVGGDVIVFLFNVAMQTITRDINNVQGMASMNDALQKRDGLTSANVPASEQQVPGAPYSGFNGSSNTAPSGSQSGNLSGVLSNWQTDNNLAPSISFSHKIAAFFVKIKASADGEGVVGLRAATGSNVASTETATGSSIAGTWDGRLTV
jgi:hypothetical protein